MDKRLKDDDYVLADGRAWFTVKDHFSVRITTTDEGMICDVYVTGHEAGDDGLLGSTYVFDSEALGFLDDKEKESS